MTICTGHMAVTAPALYRQTCLVYGMVSTHILAVKCMAEPIYGYSDQP